MRVLSDINKMRAFAEEARSAGRRIALVPTMGALHRGHLSLVKKARELADIVILTIFVNPTQFSPDEDLDSYPRDLDEDLEKASGAGVDVIFTPSAKAMYPEGFQTSVNVSGLEKNLCGLSRPGHFTGVATVVLKLFNITRPHVAVFGEKDFQQLLVIRRMVCDLDLGVEIVGADTVREADGLALSSRNSYLTTTERKAASALPSALFMAERLCKGGEDSAEVIIRAIKGALSAEKLIRVEYVKVVSARTLEDITLIRGNGEALIQVAVKVGRARLIDHIIL